MMDIVTSFKTVLAAGVVGVLALAASSASAATLSFTQITSNGSTGGAAQISVDVTDNLAGGALFEFNVIAGVNSSINVAEIYFDDRAGVFTTPLMITSQSGTDFTAGSASPGELPGGNDVNFVTTDFLLADSAPGNTAGLQIGDNIQMTIDYAAGNSFEELVASLRTGGFRIGMHVRSLDGPGDCCSEGFVNNPPGGGVLTPVPLPAGMPLLLGAFGLLAVVRRKFSKAA
jgi:hypothetical protein